MTSLTIVSGLGLAWPDEIPAPTEFEPELRANVRGSASQFDGSIQSTEVPGARWEFGLRWNVLTGEEASAMMAMAALMRGGAKRFLVPWFWRPVPLGTQRGAPTVNAAGTAGNVLALNNCTINATFKRGDVWGLSTGQCVILAEDAVALTSSVLLDVASPIRTIPPNGSVVEWDSPKFLMVSSQPSNRMPTMSGHALKNIELKFVEVFG